MALSIKDFLFEVAPIEFEHALSRPSGNKTLIWV